MSRYFKIVEISETDFANATSEELDCLQLTVTAENGDVYVAVDDDEKTDISVELEHFDV